MLFARNKALAVFSTFIAAFLKGVSAQFKIKNTIPHFKPL